MVAHYNVHKIYLVAFLVRAYGFIYGYLPGTFLLPAQHHKDLVLDTSGGIGGKTVAFFVVEGIACLDETYSSHGDKIFTVSCGCGVFLGYVCHKAHVGFDEGVPGGRIPGSYLRQNEGLLLFGQWFSECLHNNLLRLFILYYEKTR